MGQIKHYNNGKWTIYTSGEGLSGYTGVTDTYYVGPDLNNDGNLTKANPDGSLVNLEKPTYKVYTALLTQNGGDFPSELVDGDAVTKGVTYLIDVAGQDTDFSNVGGPKYDGVPMNGTYFIATNDGIPNNYGGAVLLYNTGAPVATVLENTIGNIWFGYNNAGIYKVNSSGLFTENKTIVFLGSVGDSDLSAGYTSRVFIIDNTNIGISSLVETGPSLDNVMLNTPIEIRVYN